MKHLAPLVCTLLLCAIPVYAQNSKENENNSDYCQFEQDSFKTMAGDQYIKLSLGAVAPLNFPDVQSLFNDNHQLSIGGMGTLGYHTFIFDQVALGFDIGFGFNVTIGSHIFNYVPILASITWQPSWKRFEFPLTMNIGGAWEAYNNYNYFPGLVLKPEAGIHYRIAENWSAGAEVGYMCMPQFCKLYDEGENFYGQFMTVSVAARYYF